MVAIKLRPFSFPGGNTASLGARGSAFRVFAGFAFLFGFFLFLFFKSHSGILQLQPLQRPYDKDAVNQQQMIARAPPPDLNWKDGPERNELNIEDLKKPNVENELKVEGIDNSGNDRLSETSKPEIWSGGSQLHDEFDKQVIEQVTALLTDVEKDSLAQLCGRCLYSSIFKNVAVMNMDGTTFVTTGDIEDMWTRDSAVQMGAYMSRFKKHPLLRFVVEGAIRRQAFNIIEDPWANAYSRKWRQTEMLTKFERLIGRGGFVATRNFEVDSGAYFFSQLDNYFKIPAMYGAELLLREPIIFEAVSLMVDVWIIEQNHETASPYRYSELPRDGKGAETGYTGMIWTGFRPSDDPTIYGYNIPVNMYAAGSLRRILEINDRVWKNNNLSDRVKKLLKDVVDGIQQYGVKENNGKLIYAYEVDGLGNSVLNMDDSNVPSLLSIPLLNFDYSKDIYANTRLHILNAKTNKYYFSSDKLEGIGSPHTPNNYVWPMSLAIQGLTSDDPSEKARMLKFLLECQCETGTMHESVSVNNLKQCTRQHFEWANILLVTLVENALGLDCDKPAEAFRLKNIRDRELKDKSKRPTNKGSDNELYYELLEAHVNVIE